MTPIMTAKECMTDLNEGSASLLMMLLLGGDLVFIVLHFLNISTTIFTDPLLSIERDRGYPEMYQYLKYFWIIALLLLIAWKNRAWRYVVWGGVFAYLLADDSLRIHERIGSLIAAHLGFEPRLGLRLQDFGEMAVSATAGSLFLFSLLLIYKGGSRIFKKTSQDITLLILILVFFGVVLDMASTAVNMGWKVSFMLGVIEDGGEMLSVSLLTWYFFLLSVRSDMDACYLCDLVRMVITRR